MTYIKKSLRCLEYEDHEFRNSICIKCQIKELDYILGTLSYDQLRDMQKSINNMIKLSQKDIELRDKIIKEISLRTRRFF